MFETTFQAAVMVYGNAANGWIAWKDAAGRTLKDLEAASLAGAIPALAVGESESMR